MNSSFFPSAIPDEAAFGLMTRAAILRGYKTFSEFVNSVVPEVKVPTRGSAQGGLNVLIHWLVFGAGMPTASVLQRFTNLPLYRPFVQSQFGISNAPAKWDGKTTGKPISAWFLSLGTRLDSANYCSHCAHEQDEAYGVTTWLRAHQISNVSVCWKHGCKLLSASLSVTGLALPPLSDIDPTEAFEDSDEQRFAVNMKTLLDADLPWLSPNDRASLFRKRLFEIESGSVQATGGIEAVMSLLEDQKLGSLLLPGSKLLVSDLERNMALILGLFGSVTEFAAVFRSTAAQKMGSCEPSLPRIEFVEEIRLLMARNKGESARKPLFLLEPVINLYS